VRDATGTIVGVEGTARDVTERRRAAEALRDSEARYRSIYDGSPASLWEEDLSALAAHLGQIRQTGVTDLGGWLTANPERVLGCAAMVRVLDVNDTTLDLFEAENKERCLAGLRQTFGPESMAGFRQQLLAIWEGRLESECETVNYTYGGRRLDVLLKWSVAPGHEHSYARVLVSIFDITARKRLQAEVEEQRLRAMEVNRLQALGEMAAGVAHELNQPLNGIRAFAEGMLLGLRRGWETTEAQTADTLTEVIRQVDRMAAIIDHMREFSRDRSRAEAVQFPATQVFDGALRLMGAQLRARGITVAVDLAPDLPDLIGHPSQLEQVALNLIANGRDALECRRQGRNPEGWKPQLRLAIYLDAVPGYVCLCVADNGGGVPPELATRVFEPFFTMKEVGKGTGLGLSIARRIADQHGGSLRLDNRPEEGATFILRIPVASSDPSGP
jgi:signal transduction histidine kinase